MVCLEHIRSVSVSSLQEPYFVFLGGGGFRYRHYNEEVAVWGGFVEREGESGIYI